MLTSHPDFSPPSAVSTVRVWHGAVPRSECVALVRAMVAAPARAGGVLRHGRDEPDARLRACTEHLVDAEPSAAVTAALRTVAREALAGIDPGRRALLDGPKLCSYRAGEYFRVHRDRSEDPLDADVVRARVISLVCLLNDHDPTDGHPVFDGGTLVLHVPRSDGTVAAENVPLSAGSIVAFSSDLLHEVRPVRSGVRYSAIAWLYNTTT